MIPRHVLRLVPIALFLAGFGVVAAASNPARTAQAPHLAPAARQLGRLVSQPVPYRNLFQLANELKLRPPRAIPHVISHKNPNYPVGHQNNFFVLSEDQNKYFVMPATIRAKTAHLYIYVQNGVTVSSSALQSAAQRFEHRTYPTDRKYFGSEWRPGIDGDTHVTILLGDLRSSVPAGYFSAEDEYPRVVNPWSNQRNLFYINSANTLPGTGDFDLTLAHEFQHMIHWHLHPHESLWLNEGMSMLAEQLNGFQVGGEEDAFLSQPKTQLNTWNESNDYPHYGAAYLFLSYLNGRFGARFTREMLADSKYTDFQLIDDVLKRLHIHSTSNTLFAQWVAANYVADRSVASGLYGYKNLSHRVDTGKSVSPPFTNHSTIPPYAADYTVIDSPQKRFTLSFSGPVTVPVVSARKSPPFWWSNRGDMMETSLQRTVDLRHVKHASLHFQAWWDIEQDYDYAYVEASTDGGKTFATLKGTDTTATNPNGANFGNGFTGTSKRWKNETVDLSPYAGHTIILRFQHITDDGVNGEGFLMKGMTIREIGLHDDYTGWTRSGFVPIVANALPSVWTVQLISYTSKGVKVTTLPLSSAERGSTTIDPAKTGLKKLVVVVFATAPKTTVGMTYQLSASQ